MTTSTTTEPAELPSTRAAALAAGLTRYWNGKPCKHGHTAPRTASDGHCTECVRLRVTAKQSTAEGRVKKREKDARWRAAHPDMAREKVARWRAENPDKVRERAAKRRADPILSAQDLADANERGACLRAGPAAPPWADRAALRAVYRACPEGWHVDHVVPLKGADVSGLHVPWNLRCVPAEANATKGRTFDSTDPDHLPSAHAALAVLLPAELFSGLRIRPV